MRYCSLHFQKWMLANFGIERGLSSLDHPHGGKMERVLLTPNLLLKEAVMLRKQVAWWNLHIDDMQCLWLYQSLMKRLLTLGEKMPRVPMTWCLKPSLLSMQLTWVRSAFQYVRSRSSAVLLENCTLVQRNTPTAPEMENLFVVLLQTLIRLDEAHFV